MPLLVPSALKSFNIAFLLGFYPVFTFIMLTGGLFGLPAVETYRLGRLAGHAGCGGHGHCRFAAAGRFGSGAAVEIACYQISVHRFHRGVSWCAAYHCSVYGKRHAAAVSARRCKF